MSRVVPWSLWLAIVGSFLGVGLGAAVAEDGEGSAAAYTVFVLAFATVGALVASRRAASRVPRSRTRSGSKRRPACRTLWQ